MFYYGVMCKVMQYTLMDYSFPEENQPRFENQGVNTHKAAEL